MILICMALTAMLAYAVSEYQKRRSNELFEILATDNLDALGSRLREVEIALDGAAGLVQASETITAREWSDFIDALQIDRKLPEIGGIGWIASVRKSDGSHARLERQLNERGYSIHPPTEADESLVVAYISPEAENASAIGLDITYDESRRRSLALAHASGETTLSEPLRLIQFGPEEIGFILFRSFFDAPAEGTDTLTDPVMRGLAYAPFRAGEMFAGLSAAQGRYMELRVFSGKDLHDDALIYSTSPEGDGTGFKSIRTVEFYGQDFTFCWEGTPAFVVSQKSLMPYYIAVSGLFLSALIGLSTLTHARRTRAIEAEIEEQTRELKASSDQTKAMIDNAMVGISVLDADTRIMSVNPALLEMFEFDEADVIGSRLCDFIPAMPSKPWKGTIFVESATGSGKTLCLKSQVNEWRNKSGDRRYIVLFDDVTEEQAVTNRLREAEYRLNLALNASEIGIYDIDVRSGRSVVSDSWVALMRLDRETMADNPQDEFFRRIHPSDLQTVLDSNQECIDGRVSKSVCEYRIELATGDWRWMKSNTSVAETDENGTPTRLIGAQTDFTELHRAHTSLRDSRRQFLEILENAPVPLALLDEGGLFIRVNQSLARLTGYTRDELLGVDFQTLIHPEDLKDMLRAIEQIRTGKAGILKVEGRCLHKAGHEMWMLLSVSRARDNVTDTDLFIAQFVDISQRKEIEKSNREFFANMSHELRTPLTSVKGAIDLVVGTAKAKLPDNVQNLLSIAQGNSDRLARLLNDLLDLEKVSTNRMRFHYGLQNLADVVSKSVIAATPIAETRNVQLETRLPSQDIHVWTDASRLEQVLLNLLSNAMKYSEPGQTVTVSLTETDDDLVLAVADAGPGIPDNYRDMVFQPFSQADTSATRKTGGTGLGLSIAKSLAESMGGAIDFDSEMGVGTVFRVRLPKHMSSEQMAQLDDPGQLRILHVEPDRHFSRLLGQWLGPNRTLVNAASLEVALTEFERQRFQAIILNWNAIDADQKASLYRLRHQHPQLRIVGLSEDVSEGLDSVSDLDLSHAKLPMHSITRKLLRLLGAAVKSPVNVS